MNFVSRDTKDIRILHEFLFHKTRCRFSFRMVLVVGKGRALTKFAYFRKSILARFEFARQQIRKYLAKIKFLRTLVSLQYAKDVPTGQIIEAGVSASQSITEEEYPFVYPNADN